MTVSSWFSLYFGDQKNLVEPDELRGKVWPAFDALPNQPMIFQHQVHETGGHAVSTQTLELLKTSLVYNSDYLITNLPQVGIGILTADCLPIALADPINHAIALVHAGWRGTVGEIARAALAHMHELYGTRPEDILVYYGPCAHTCCYQVDTPFLEQLPTWARAAVIARDGRDYFDLLLCNTLVLESCGVKKNSFDTSHSKCTICNHNFCSYRRNPGTTARQMSIIWIH